MKGAGKWATESLAGLANSGDLKSIADRWQEKETVDDSTQKKMDKERVKSTNSPVVEKDNSSGSSTSSSTQVEPEKKVEASSKVEGSNNNKVESSTTTTATQTESAQPTKEVAAVVKKEEPKAPVGPSTAYYMQVPGIEGDVETEGYKGWIRVYTSQFGTGRGIYTPGGGGETEMSDASVSELVLTKGADRSSVPLFNAFLRKRFFDTIKLVSVRQPYGEVFLTQTMRSVAISGISISVGGGRYRRNKVANPKIPRTESISLNYAEITAVNTELDNFVERLSRFKSIGEKFRDDQITGHLTSYFGVYDIPKELTFVIFSLLDKKSLAAASMTCKNFFRMATDPRLLIIDTQSTKMIIGFGGRRRKPGQEKKEEDGTRAFYNESVINK
eukprot:TRINITY_DN2893_c0_g1_i1.p1 TRINITY_DN2893_c0_g1~~TRINITY_DN2893_c0_g1_i1.p1  ORF type:complete len:404 (-),score=103.89 TRINITY_DN2893_c0_g1_i1:33-1193(-)